MSGDLVGGYTGDEVYGRPLCRDRFEIRPKVRDDNGRRPGMRETEVTGVVWDLVPVPDPVGRNLGPW